MCYPFIPYIFKEMPCAGSPNVRVAQVILVHQMFYLYRVTTFGSQLQLVLGMQSMWAARQLVCTIVDTIKFYIVYIYNWIACMVKRLIFSSSYIFMFMCSDQGNYNIRE